MSRPALLAVLLAGCATTVDPQHQIVTPDPPGAGPEEGGTTATPPAPDAEAAWSLGAPFATTAPTFAKASHALAPTALWGDIAGPRPTNAAWMDVVLGNGANPFHVYPYAVKALDGGLEVSLPTKTVAQNAVIAVVRRDLAFGAVEPFAKHVVTAHDDLSVTVRWTAGNGAMTTPLVRGMPYATARYDKLTPRLDSVHALLTLDGAPVPASKTGDRFLVTMNDGRAWVVYASSPITFTRSASTLTATQPFTGTLRVAAVTQQADLAVLDAHRSAVPVGGDVLATVSGDRAKITFQWKKEGGGPLASATMVHHSLSGSTTKLGVTYPSVRGPLALVEGDAWTVEQPLVPYAWNAPRPAAPARIAAIRAALMEDAKVLPAAEDPYFFGKQVARLGRLALIADELGDAATAANVRASMKAKLDPWLAGKNASPLVYDTVWGGLCSTRGLADRNADFGGGWYNDHHFHYGYFLYAAAALGKGDAAWLSAQRGPIVTLAREIANPSKSDPYFTRFRHMDWYEGHSWAAGLFEFGDGRNQESTSEAVNAWYGLELLGRALGDTNMTNTGRVMLATEILGAQTYWQIKAGSRVYDEPFASRKVVGVLWGGKVDHATFFGPNLEFIHGIQMLPFTPVTEALLPKAWVTEAYPLLAGVAASASQGWRGVLYMDHAIVDREAAWKELEGLTEWDDGNSRTNALHWVATRP